MIIWKQDGKPLRSQHMLKCELQPDDCVFLYINKLMQKMHKLEHESVRKISVRCSKFQGKGHHPNVSSLWTPSQQEWEWSPPLIKHTSLSKDIKLVHTHILRWIFYVFSVHNRLLTLEKFYLPADIINCFQSQTFSSAGQEHCSGSPGTYRESPGSAGTQLDLNVAPVAETVSVKVPKSKFSLLKNCSISQPQSALNIILTPRSPPSSTKHYGPLPVTPITSFKLIHSSVKA